MWQQDEQGESQKPIRLRCYLTVTRGWQTWSTAHQQHLGASGQSFISAESHTTQRTILDLPGWQNIAQEALSV